MTTEETAKEMISTKKILDGAIEELASLKTNEADAVKRILLAANGALCAGDLQELLIAVQHVANKQLAALCQNL